ncbi:hypothetical protein V6N12_041176 [Hibiscus sabdariffa]|uniref:Peptidase M14 domain-containing protein n=1 Tax=Hibiscus sabdariffa TaxID=183260 RepID=A0ABR2E5V3_9ROSI
MMDEEASDYRIANHYGKTCFFSLGAPKIHLRVLCIFRVGNECSDAEMIQISDKPGKEEPEPAFKVNDLVLCYLERKNYDACPDDGTFRFLASIYSKSYYNMSLSKQFERGITNGAAWYPIYDSMQDWNYIHGGCFELTLEISDNKWPNSKESKECTSLGAIEVKKICSQRSAEEFGFDVLGEEISILEKELTQGYQESTEDSSPHIWHLQDLAQSGEKIYSPRTAEEFVVDVLGEEISILEKELTQGYQEQYWVLSQ